MGKDLTEAFRVLWKSPRFAWTAIVVLALGIGVNSATFTLVYSALLRPLPYAEPERVAVIMGTSPLSDAPFSIPPADYLDFRTRTRSFGPMAAAELWQASLTGAGEAEELHGMRATAQIFDVFGVPAARGRTFLPEYDRPQAPRVVVLASSLWKRRFGGANSVGLSPGCLRPAASICPASRRSASARRWSRSTCWSACSRASCSAWRRPCGLRVSI